jgi:hypothetical protein
VKPTDARGVRKCKGIAVEKPQQEVWVYDRWFARLRVDVSQHRGGDGGDRAIAYELSCVLSLDQMLEVMWVEREQEQVVEQQTLWTEVLV